MSDSCPPSNELRAPLAGNFPVFLTFSIDDFTLNFTCARSAPSSGLESERTFVPVAVIGDNLCNVSSAS